MSDRTDVINHYHVYSSSRIHSEPLTADRRGKVTMFDFVCNGFESLLAMVELYMYPHLFAGEYVARFQMC
jgi:hypothetical protein